MIFIFIILLCFDVINSQNIRLRGGSHSWEGRVEVEYYVEECAFWQSCQNVWSWGTVCDDGFGSDDGRVACRSLGWMDVVSVQSFGGGSGTIWLDDLGCSGSESRLWHCSNPGWGANNCGHGEDVGVVCDRDECESNPCQLGGTCTDGITRYDCNCVAGTTGTNCQINIDECASTPCQNGAACVDNINYYTCNCAPGWEGTHCESDINECLSNPCQNGATCVDQLNRYECVCITWFYSSDCSLEDTSYSSKTFSLYNENTLTNHLLKKIVARSNIECMSTCLTNSNCLSSNFEVLTKTCELNSSTKTENLADYLFSKDLVYIE